MNGFVTGKTEPPLQFYHRFLIMRVSQEPARSKAVSYRSRENEIGGFHFHFAPITVTWKWDSRLYYLSAYRWAEIPCDRFSKNLTLLDFIIVVAWDFGQILTYVPMKWDCEKVWIHIDPEIPVLGDLNPEQICMAWTAHGPGKIIWITWTGHGPR